MSWSKNTEVPFTTDLTEPSGSALNNMFEYPVETIEARLSCICEGKFIPNDVEILIVIDEKYRNVGPSVEKIFKELKKRFSDKFGKGVNVSIREVDSISKGENKKFFKVVVSKVKPEFN